MQKLYKAYHTLILSVGDKLPKRKPRPSGTITITDPRGYAYIPDNIKEELGIPKGERRRIPFFVDANCVLLVREDATLEEIIKGLEVLKEDIKLRAKDG